MRKLHKHRCGSCGCIWSHGEEMRKNTEAHTCPRCGDGPWWDHYRPGFPFIILY